MDKCHVLGCDEDLASDSDNLCMGHREKADNPKAPADVINAMGNAVPTGKELAEYLIKRKMG